ncbi:hypothetical protein BGX31_005783 [Mortierella sp. GBA43]|nr:hypothetical protein BGX31_005783 [Mortierella sp. GBA43]
MQSSTEGFLQTKLLPRISSTLGGTDHYLTEIRNIVKTKEDVKAIWDCKPEEIKILGIDLGQACVVGASALLLSHEKVSSKDKQPKFINLSVKQKAVVQPTLKHRRWMEQRKARVVYDSQSISDIESSLPPLRGQGASVEQYIKRLEEVEAHLDSFYNGSNTIKKHRWNATRARVTKIFSNVKAILFARDIPIARSLGYVVVGVNEYYTSKKCPTCKNFVG